MTEEIQTKDVNSTINGTQHMNNDATEVEDDDYEPNNYNGYTCKEDLWKVISERVRKVTGSRWGRIEWWVGPWIAGRYYDNLDDIAVHGRVRFTEQWQDEKGLPRSISEELTSPTWLQVAEFEYRLHQAKRDKSQFVVAGIAIHNRGEDGVLNCSVSPYSHSSLSRYSNILGRQIC